MIARLVIYDWDNNNYNLYLYCNNFLFVWRKFEYEYDGKTGSSNNTLYVLTYMVNFD